MTDQELSATVGNNVFLIREKRKMTQKQLAEKSGVAIAALTRIESGKNSNPTLKTMNLLARAMQVSIKELVAT